MGVWGGQNREGVVVVVVVFFFWGSSSVPVLVKIDQEMRPMRVLADRYTH